MEVEMSSNEEKTINKQDGLSVASVRLPAARCVTCDKSLEEIGGKRIVAQQLRGVCLSDRYEGGGNKDYPRQSFKLSEDPDVYLQVWGEKVLWTPAAIDRAKDAYLSGLRPWICQICGQRKCSVCGQAINMAVGSDVLYDNGCSSHVPIIPCDLGCVNKACKKYRP